MGSSSILVKISYLVLIRKIGMIKNRLILTGIFIEMGMIEIEYDLIFNIPQKPILTPNEHQLSQASTFPQ